MFSRKPAMTKNACNWHMFMTHGSFLKLNKQIILLIFCMYLYRHFVEYLQDVHGTNIATISKIQPKWKVVVGTHFLAHVWERHWKFTSRPSHEKVWNRKWSDRPTFRKRFGREKLMCVATKPVQRYWSGRPIFLQNFGREPKVGRGVGREWALV